MDFTRRQFLTVAGTSLLTLAADSLAYSTPSFAKEVSSIKDTTFSVTEEPISSDVYELLESYYTGNYQCCSEDENFASNLFDYVDNNIAEELNVQYLYNISEDGNGNGVATRLALYSSTELSRETQDVLNNVILLCRISYLKQSFTGYDCIMLTRVTGGVVQNALYYYCANLQLRYNVSGDAYDANGTRIGYRGNSCNYVLVSSFPTAGVQYSISGPNDYYYNMGVTSSVTAGFTKGSIYFSHTETSSDLEVASAITGW